MHSEIYSRKLQWISDDHDGKYYSLKKPKQKFSLKLFQIEFVQLNELTLLSTGEGFNKFDERHFLKTFEEC